MEFSGAGVYFFVTCPPLSVDENPRLLYICHTGLVKDLIDGNDSKSGYDKVTGFTKAQVETAFKKNTKWNSLKEYFKPLKVAKDEDIDELFDHWAGPADGSL